MCVGGYIAVTTLDQYLLQHPEGTVVGVIDQSLGADALALGTANHPDFDSVDDLPALIAQLAEDGDKPVLAYVQLVGTNVTDLGDLWEDRNPDALREALRDELIIVAAVLHALGETFAPSGLGGYRPVDAA